MLGTRIMSGLARLQMRGFKALAGGTVLIAALVAAAEPSFAQSLLQRLFGFGGSRTPEYRDGRMGSYGYGSPRYDYDEDWEEDTSTYRTLCVRLCDGFYFPISEGVRREGLYRDSRACMQRCDGEARLFYYPTFGGSVETMVDLSGRSYTELPNAFRYRKSLVEGCACKPAPWSAEAAARHQGYAAEGAQQAADAGPEPEDDGERRSAGATGVMESGVYYEPRRSYTPLPRRMSRRPRTPWARLWDGWGN
jgi:hypothetical protein